jgi:hypothetical protein
MSDDFVCNCRRVPASAYGVDLFQGREARDLLARGAAAPIPDSAVSVATSLAATGPTVPRVALGGLLIGLPLLVGCRV